MHGPERTFLRPKDDRKIAGVCAALARRAGFDATLLRGAGLTVFLGVTVLVVLCLLWWPTLLLIPLLYLALAVALPSE